jgi:hypothetical protein
VQFFSIIRKPQTATRKPRTQRRSAAAPQHLIRRRRCIQRDPCALGCIDAVVSRSPRHTAIDSMKDPRFDRRRAGGPARRLGPQESKRSALASVAEVDRLSRELVPQVLVDLKRRIQGRF